MTILFEDNQILVAQKPVGILSQSDGTDSPDMLTELKKIIKNRDDKPGNVFLGLVHRLDKNVAGIMVFAKNSKSAGRLSKSIINGEMDKRYIAILDGALEKDTNEYQTLENYLVKDKEINKALIFDSAVDAKTYESFHPMSERAKLSKLKYKIIEIKDNKTLIEINLETGRFHQIRAQFAHLGFALIGDTKYNPKPQSEKFPALWAYRLSFPHPITHEILNFSSFPGDEKPWGDFDIHEIKF
ncbi:MAG: RluA family pseudouridine synthase [Candidatus Dojkabacteria bacterium]